MNEIEKIKDITNRYIVLRMFYHNPYHRTFSLGEACFKFALKRFTTLGLLRPRHGRLQTVIHIYRRLSYYHDQRILRAEAQSRMWVPTPDTRSNRSTKTCTYAVPCEHHRFYQTTVSPSRRSTSFHRLSWSSRHSTTQPTTLRSWLSQWARHTRSAFTPRTSHPRS